MTKTDWMTSLKAWSMVSPTTEWLARLDGSLARLAEDLTTAGDRLSALAMAGEIALASLAERAIREEGR